MNENDCRQSFVINLISFAEKTIYLDNTVRFAAVRAIGETKKKLNDRFYNPKINPNSWLFHLHHEIWEVVHKLQVNHHVKPTTNY